MHLDYRERFSCANRWERKAQFSGNLRAPDVRSWANSWRWWVCITSEQRDKIVKSLVWLPLTPVPAHLISVHLSHPPAPFLPSVHFLECLSQVMQYSNLTEVQWWADSVFSLETTALGGRDDQHCNGSMSQCRAHNQEEISRNKRGFQRK